MNLQYSYFIPDIPFTPKPYFYSFCVVKDNYQEFEGIYSTTDAVFGDLKSFFGMFFVFLRVYLNQPITVLKDGINKES